MSDPTPTAGLAAGESAASASRRLKPFWRWARRILGVLAAVTAALLVAGFSLDLGPAVRARIEKEGVNYLERPFHVGKVSALLTPGEFRLDDVRIEGLTPDAKPFLTAKTIFFKVNWWTLARSQFTVDVRMTDWTMAVETFSGTPSSNVPKLKPKNPPGPKKWYMPKVTRVNFVYADRGAFSYDDHVTPWHVDAPNLAVDLAWANALDSYVGTAHFAGGTVKIQNFLPMRADLTARFAIDSTIVRLPSIDLVTDGAHSRVRGEVDFSKWPEQRYLVDSDVDFARMRELFFANETWRVSGQGRFQGTFHVFKGGRDLRGDFTSALATVDNYRFPNLKGSLAWLPSRFEVTNASADLYGGRAAFDYALDPLGTPGGAQATFNANYTDVDLETIGREFSWTPLRLRGRATGNMAMRWPNGHSRTALTAEGEATVTPPSGATLAGPALPPAVIPPAPEPAGVNTAEPVAPLAPVAPPSAPFDKNLSVSPLTLGGHVKYRLDNTTIHVEDSWAATAHTYVSFRGQSEYANAANYAFHVTSTDWQESDRVLVGIMQQFGSHASAVEVGGRGTFDGTFTEKFSQPKVAGRFEGDSIRAFDNVRWGRALGDIVIQNAYVDVKNAIVGDTPAARVFADGRFALGYPRQDGGEEIHARIQAEHWPMADFRHAFRLDTWPIDGLLTADISLTGPYERPYGTGTLSIDDGVAWKETFEHATGAMSFEGTGLNISRIVMNKGPGVIHGAMWIGWDKTYTFDSDGDHIPVESLKRFALPRAPLSGVLKFTATGTGNFDAPTYAFQGRVADLFVGDEGIGQVTGHLTVKTDLVTIDFLEATSERLQISGSGTVALNEAYDGNLNFRFSNTSIDPYLKFLTQAEPKISPFLRLIAGGSLRVAGELANPSELVLDASIDDAKLTLLDYDLHNDGVIHLTLDRNLIRIPQLKLAGNGTNLEVRGTVPLTGEPYDLTATGDVSLAILQGLSSLKYVSSSGNATLSAKVSGIGDNPVFSGYADVKDGRIRHISLPRSLENINGRIGFDSLGINVDQLHATMGSGDVAFGGSISLKGLVPGEFNLTAIGRSMRLRYPQGFETTVDADLQLRGPIGSPTLSGTVDVVHSTFMRQIEADLSVLLAGGAAGAVPAPAITTSDTGFPLTFDIRVQAPPIAIIDVKDMKIYGHIDALWYRGTLDHPILQGTIQIDSGEIFFAGNRYAVKSGSIDFQNPNKIEPFFDIELETRLRALGQTYIANLRTIGTLDRFNYQLTSDPVLPQYDILSLMLGESPDPGTAEQRALGSPQEAQNKALGTFMAQLIASPLSSRVGSVVEKTGALDTVAISPLLGGNQTSAQQLTPGAKLTLGKRLSSNVYLTYSRTLNQAQLEVIVLEYDASDRVSWVLSKNEDHTFSLDFRIRHVF